VEENRRRALSNVTASVTLLRSSQKNICDIPHAIGSCVKKKKMETDKYCSSVVHLFRGRELGSRNVLTGNAKRCTTHKILQTYDNIIGCNRLFYDGIYSSLGTCHSVIRGSCDKKYTNIWPHTKDVVHLIPMIYRVIQNNPSVLVKTYS